MSFIINFIKGIIVGIAVLIPGLSGSMFAVIVGLYEKMITAVSTLRKNFKKNVLFLLPIAIGGLIGILVSAKIVEDLRISYPQQTYFFFIGSVLGSVPLVIRKLRRVEFKPSYLFISFLCLGFILIMGYLTGGEDSVVTSQSVNYMNGFNDVLSVFIAGFFSCSLMSIPGVSGSVTLMVLGEFDRVYGAVGDCSDMIKMIIKGDFGNALLLSRSFVTAIVFAIGGILGFLIIAKLIAKVILKFETQMYYGVLGMIFGAMIILFVDGVLSDLKVTFMSGSSAGSIVGVLVIDALLVVIGVICTLFLDDDSALAQKMKKGKSIKGDA